MLAEFAPRLQITAHGTWRRPMGKDTDTWRMTPWAEEGERAGADPDHAAKPSSARRGPAVGWCGGTLSSSPHPAQGTRTPRCSAALLDHTASVWVREQSSFWEQWAWQGTIEEMFTVGSEAPQDPSDCCFPQVSGSFPRQSTGQKVGLPQCFSYQAKDKSCHTQA